jgi:hypothetical protein
LACLNNGNPGDDSLGKLPVFHGAAGKDRRGKENNKEGTKQLPTRMKKREKKRSEKIRGGIIRFNLRYGK